MRRIVSPLDGIRSPLGQFTGFNPASRFAQVSVSPAFLYSTARMVSAYNGSAIRVLRPSDSAEQDIGFSGNRLDETSLYGFLGTETGKVLKLYDQSGNGNHTDTQVADANRFSIGFNLRHNGNLVLMGSAALYTLPAALTFDRRGSTFYTVADTLFGLHGYWRVGSSGDPYQISTNGSWNNVTPALYPAFNPSVVEYYLGASSVIESFNAETRTAAAKSAGTETGGIIGTSDSSYKFNGYGSCWIGYTSALSSSDRSTVKTALNYAFGTTLDTPTARVLFVGDSITVGSAGTLSYGFARRTQRALPNTVMCNQYAGAGNQVQNYVANYSTSQGKIILTTYTSTSPVVFLHMGTNDLTIGGRTAAQIYSDIQSYAALVKADGARIIISTLLPNSAWTAGQQTTRNDLNSSIRSGWASFADGLCDFANDAVMGPQAAASNTSLYSDGLHPTDTGHQYLSVLSTAAIRGLL